MFDEFRRFVPPQIRRSYAAKFGIVLLVIGVSVGLIGSAATIQISNEVQGDIDQEYEDVAIQQAGDVEQWMERNTVTTRLTGGTQVLELGTRTQLERHLDIKLAELPDDIHSMHVVEAEKGEVEVSTELDRGTDATDKPWWSEAEAVYEGGDTDEVRQSGAYMADAESLDGDGETSVAFTTLVSEDNDRVLVVGVSTAELGPEQFASVDRTELVQVVDGDGTVVMSENPDDHLELISYPTEDGADRPLEVAQAGGDTGVVAMDGNEQIMEEEYIVAYAKIEGTDWVVLTHNYHPDSYEFVTTVSQIGLMATFVGVALITVLGAFLGRNTATAIDRLTAKTQRMEEGDLSVDFETHRIDNIGRLYDGFGSMQEVLREQIQEAQAARQEAESAREEAEMTNRHLEEKADEYSEVMGHVADGDLTRRMDPESGNEAMAEIAQEFNAMIREIELTTETVKEFSMEVTTSSEEVTASSEEVKGASEQVTDSIQEITDGAERQNEQLQSVAEEMNSLSTTIEEIAASANQVAELSQQTAETGDDARQRAEVAIDEMETVEAESEATVVAMEQLQAQMEQIEEITEFITEVAEQTNILALNANIEAARAGEAGEGFAVVAEEVKSLAEETREAAGEIEGLIETVRDQTEHTAEEVEQTAEEVARSTDIVEETVDALDEIAGYAEETNVGVQEISNATSDQAASTNQVVSMVDDAASISEQTSRESENVAAAAEQQTTALTEVTTSASDLAEQASQLSSALERFQTDGEGREAIGIDDANAVEPGAVEGSASDDPDDLDTPEFDDLETPGLEDLDTPEFDDLETPGLEDLDTPGIDDLDTSGPGELEEAGSEGTDRDEDGDSEEIDGEAEPEHAGGGPGDELDAEAETSPDLPDDLGFDELPDSGSGTGFDDAPFSGGAIDTDSLPFDVDTEGTGSIEIGDIDAVIDDTPDSAASDDDEEEAGDDAVDQRPAAREDAIEEWFDAQIQVREEIEEAVSDEEDASLEDAAEDDAAGDDAAEGDDSGEDVVAEDDDSGEDVVAEDDDSGEDVVAEDDDSGEDGAAGDEDGSSTAE